MASKFTGMPSVDRRSAQALLNGYNAKLRAWQRQADQLDNLPHVDIGMYVGYTDRELSAYQTAAQFRTALEYRLLIIDERVATQKQRYEMRRSRQHVRAYARAVKAGYKRGRGRPRIGASLTYGQYVYFAIAYNHGMGAGFLEYVAEESPPNAPTNITDWT